ncbi:MAG TPA: GntR family transcriptional regulator [Capsulimonadaceae bacterium]|jgi:DNA-binding LacI/PurR family transcriptional regulator
MSNTTTKQHMKPSLSRTPANSKVGVVERHLRELALSRGANAQLPTIDEMCVSYETSRATINDALGALEALNIVDRRRGKGIFVSPKLFQRRIALVFGDQFVVARHTSPFWDTLWANLIEEADKRLKTHDETISIHGVRTSDGILQPLDDNLARQLETRQIDVVVSVGLDRQSWLWIRGHDIPVVSFAGEGTYFVTIDSAKLVTMCMDKLLDAGCKSIRLWRALPANSAVINDDAHLLNVEVVQAYRDALERRNIPFDPAMVWVPQGERASSEGQLQQQGEALVDRLIAGGYAASTDGIVILDDVMASGAYKKMLRAGIARYIRVASHANRGTSVLYAYQEDIDRVFFDPEEIARAMFSLVDQVLADGTAAPEVVPISPTY